MHRRLECRMKVRNCRPAVARLNCRCCILWNEVSSSRNSIGGYSNSKKVWAADEGRGGRNDGVWTGSAWHLSSSVLQGTGNQGEAIRLQWIVRCGWLWLDRQGRTLVEHPHCGAEALGTGKPPRILDVNQRVIAGAFMLAAYCRRSVLQAPAVGHRPGARGANVDLDPRRGRVGKGAISMSTLHSRFSVGSSL